MGVLAVFAVLAIGGAGYALSLRFFPWWPCSRCGGSKIRKHPGSGKVAKAHGGCRRCGGKGRHPRLGVKVFTPSRASDLVSGKTGRYG